MLICLLAGVILSFLYKGIFHKVIALGLAVPSIILSFLEITGFEITEIVNNIVLLLILLLNFLAVIDYFRYFYVY